MDALERFEEKWAKAGYGTPRISLWDGKCLFVNLKGHTLCYRLDKCWAKRRMSAPVSSKVLLPKELFSFARGLSHYVYVYRKELVRLLSGESPGT